MNTAESKILDEIYNEAIQNVFDEMLTPIYRESGETAIRNKSKLITDDQINKILKLLHPDYRDLGMTITIYKNKFQVFKDWFNTFKEYIHTETLKMSFKRQITGNHLEGVIAVFPFNFRLKKKHSILKFKQLLLISVLIHEIRHAYQRIYKEYKYEESNYSYIDATGKGYHSQWVERDANHFTQRFMNKNKKKINEILDINFDWNCTWGRFNITLK